MSRIGLVTGASRGIGAATAIALAATGVHVVLIARTQGGLEETDDAIRAAGGTASLLPMDLGDGAQLDLVGPSLLERFGRLDILVHAAAALGRLTPVPHILPGDFDTVVAVNLASTWRLIRTCGPLLLAAEAGRAVFVADATPPRAYWGAYGATKAAMQHLVQCWAAETVASRCRVNLFDPGPVGTRLRAAAMPGVPSDSLRQPADVAPGIVALCAVAETRHGEVVPAA